MDVDKIKKTLRSKIIGKHILFFDEVGSTNDKAAELARAGPEQSRGEGTVVIAARQTAGKGRRGRMWLSSGEDDLTFSVILRPHLSRSKLFPLTLLGSLASVRAVNWLAGISARCKWPNDITARGKKLGGVLCEVPSAKKGPDPVIVGIGLNVNNGSFPEEISDSATSIFIEAGEKVSREKLFAAIIDQFDSLYSSMLLGGVRDIISEWKTVSSTLGQDVKAVTKKGVVSGLAMDIGGAGELIIRDKSGRIKKLNSSEIVKLES